MVVLKNPLLLAFEKVVEMKTIHSAAAELRLTQAAVTKRIRQLESDLNVSLFLRSRKGMTLTDEGKALYQFCKTTSEIEGQLLSHLKGYNEREVSLTLVGPTSAISTRIAANCGSLYAQFPFLNLHLLSDDHSNLVEAVKKGEADFAVIPPEEVPNEMDSKVLKSDRYLLVASSKWKGKKLEDILENERVIDFYESDTTTRNYLKKFNLLSMLKRSRLFVNENEALIRYFSSGVGFGTLTESVAEPYLKSGALIALNRGQAMEDPLALIWYPRAQKPKYFEAIIRSIK